MLDACNLTRRDHVLEEIEHPEFSDWVLKIDANKKLSWVMKPF